MATAATMQPIPEIGFEDPDIVTPHTDITLFNVSPHPSSGRTPRMGLRNAYYSASPMTNRRSQRILLKKKQMEKLKEEQAEQQKHVRFARPNISVSKSNSTLSRMSRERMDKTQIHQPLNSSRRQEFLEKRKNLIQEEIKRQLSIPINPTTEPKHKETSNTVDDYQDASEVTLSGSSRTSDVVVTPGQNLEIPQAPVRPGLSVRRNTLIRSSSFAVRSANTITRKAVGIMNDALEEGRKERRKSIAPVRSKSTKEQQEEQKQLVRKYSMLWMSKTAQKKRMDFMRPSEDLEDYTPFKKFRRAARLIKSLIQICRVCQEIVLDSVSSEDWYKKIESYIDSTEMLSKAQGPSKVRPFITFVQDAKSKELKQLSFDKSMFARERRADYLLTSEIRQFLQIPAYDRTIDQENEILMFMKRAVPDFNSYSLETQKKIIQCMHYDKYDRDRVITRQGLTADGIYFILSGTLIEKDDDKKHVREMKPGELFGEEDIICGCPRRTTVITRSEVELVSIHRLDYRAIVHMADDSNHPKYLDICKHDIVFQHFPMRRLMDNPGVWTVLSYKYGRLIVKDSNEMEWIYIIKSGEAKVLKELKTRQIDLHERRHHLQLKRNKTDPHAFQRKMIGFVSERDYLKSQYKKGEYCPGGEPFNPKKILASTRQIQSAPHKSGRSKQNIFHSLPSTPAKSRTKCSFPIRPALRKGSSQFDSPRNKASEDNLSQAYFDRQDSRNSPQSDGQQSADILKVEFESDDIHEEHASEEETPKKTVKTPENEDHQCAKLKPRESKIKIIDARDAEKDTKHIKRQSSYIDTSSKSNVKFPVLEKSNSKSSLMGDDKKKRMINIPRFVQLESLHAGKVFGLRSCLPADERGSSASLVSGGCEVLQVNKKFFMKHADEALIGLIRVQNKPFPSEDDLIDRLDNNFQWEEFKQNTLGDFLVQTGRMTREEKGNVTIDLAGS